MTTPYDMLGVVKGATDDEIKQAYLEQVKKFPPDRDPERFQLVNRAYASIKDRKSRLSHELFDLPIADFERLLDQALVTPNSLQITREQFVKLLTAGLDDDNLLNAIAENK